MKRMIGVLLAALALDAGTKWLASELLAGSLLFRPQDWKEA